jgi:hypothetical protein
VRRTLQRDEKLLSPVCRRRFVVVLQDQFRVSQRRACRLAGQNRNTQHRPMPLVVTEEQKLRRWIRVLPRRLVLWGKRLVYCQLPLRTGASFISGCNGSGGRRASSGPSRSDASAHSQQTVQVSWEAQLCHTTSRRSTSSSIKRWMAGR